MLFQNQDLSRILIISLGQPVVVIIFLFLAYKILKRKKNISTLILSSFYFFIAIAFLLNIIFIIFSLISFNLILFPIYIAISYLILTAPINIIIFIISLLKDYTNKKYIQMYMGYIIVSILIFLVPGGIKINSTTLRPEYSWTFFIVSYVYFSSFMSLPTIYLSFRLYYYFEDKTLKKKLSYFLIGIFSLYLVFYGSVLYNTWDFAIYRTIWGYFSITFLISSALLIYYGMGQNL